MNARHYASTPDGQLCFILALKVCEGARDIAYNIYTSRLPLQDCCLNGPLGGPEVGSEGTMAWRQPPACVCTYCICANYSLTDREGGVWQAIAVWQMPCTNASHRLDVNGQDWDEALRLTARLDQGQGGKYRSQGSGERWAGGRTNITFICLTSVTTAWQAAYEYWGKVCKAVLMFWGVNYLWGGGDLSLFALRLCGSLVFEIWILPEPGSCSTS